MPSLFEQTGNEVMYRANVAVTPPDTKYMRENNKVLSGIGYFKDLYLGREQDLFRTDALDHFRRLEYSKNSKTEPRPYNLAQDILYRAALNPGKN